MGNQKLSTLCNESKFLIVDDFENFRSSLRLMLSSFGANSIETASNAEKALELCKFDSFDVILCDLNLGAGKNGQQVLEELRIKKRLKRTHLFAMVTADTSKEAVLGTREFQPDAYIAKPVTRSTLEERLLQLLSQQVLLKPINKEIDLENYAKAISLCQQEIDKGSRYRSWCLQTMADLYRKIGDSSSAQKIYTEVLSKRPIDWAKIGLGKTLYDSNQYEEAKNVFSSAAEQSPFLVEAFEGISDSCLKLGQKSDAQSALTQAVSISPRMVKRQTKLAQLCVENNDLTSASEAFRHAVSFGQNTVHEVSKLYLDFGRCLSDLALGDTSIKGDTLASEASIQLETVLRKFVTEEEACHCANLIRSRILIDRGNKPPALNLIEKTQNTVDQAHISAELGIELSRSLYAAGNLDEAEKILIDLAQRFAQDPDALAKIESVLDEPEPLEIKIKAKGLNKSGISLFESGRLEEAVEAFSSAIALTPKHAALNLNLAQVAIKLYQETKDSSHLSLAQQSLERIEHIPEQHKQYRRLQHIRALLEKTKNEVK